MDLQTARRILLWHADHDPVYMEGVSEQAIQRIGDFLREAEYADPVIFGQGPHGRGDARKNLRYLCALVPLKYSEELPECVRDLVGNPGLRSYDVAEIISWRGARQGSGKELPGEIIQEVGDYLKRGASYYKAAKEIGVHADTVSEIGTYMGVKEAREDAFREYTTRYLETGRTDPHELAYDTGMTIRKADTLIQEVNKGLQECRGALV